MGNPTHRRWRNYARNVFCLACGLVLVSCGGTGNDGGSIAPTPEEVSYDWALPAIDTGADGVDGEIYQALQKGCDDGDRVLTQKWQQSSSPRNVLLFAAGVQACRGDMNGARTLYGQAQEQYGWTGLGPTQDSARCDVYKSVASVLEKAPRDSFPCLDGTNPEFKRSPDGVPDDPLTPVDESAAVVTSTAAPPPPPPATKVPTTKAPSKPKPQSATKKPVPPGGSTPTTKAKSSTGCGTVVRKFFGGAVPDGEDDTSADSDDMTDTSTPDETDPMQGSDPMETKKPDKPDKPDKNSGSNSNNKGSDNKKKDDCG